MTSLFALVSAAAQSLRTRQRTDVLDVDATQLIAIVFAARPLLLAALLATRVIGFACQISAGDLPVHVTASTLDVAAQVALRTLTHVTWCFAGVRITCTRRRDTLAHQLGRIIGRKIPSRQTPTRLAALETLRANFLASRHGVQATLSLLR